MITWIQSSILSLLLLCTGLAHAETTIYYHTNALGSPVAATDAQGNVLWRENYAPYGDRLLEQDGGTENTWYTGKQHDDSIGLSYFGARWYDPVHGRFMAMDPVGFQEDNIHSFNKYAYANNNPYKYVDPDGRNGLAAMEIMGIIGILYLGAAVLPDHEQRVGSLGLLLNAFNENANEGSPDINPKEVAGKTPDEIDQLAKEKGLIPKGDDPKAGKGAYVDPATGKQRVLCHPNCDNPHAHVNGPDGTRLDVNGNPTVPESPDAHLPINTQ